MSEWISVKDKLPENQWDVLMAFKSEISDEFYVIALGFIGRDKNWYHAGGAEAGNITHWMPLPEPPKAESAGGK